MNTLKIPPFQSGGLILSYECSNACQHCIYACTPSWKGWIDEDDLDILLEQIRLFAPEQKGLHISGGEPFLNFELTLKAVERCIENGIMLQYIETNANWCEDDDITAYQFMTLRDSGLPAILISVSPFHNEFVPFDCTDRAVRIAREIYGPYNVLVYTGHYYDQLKDFDHQQKIPLKRYMNSIGIEKAAQSFIEQYGLIPLGRAASRLHAFFQKQPAKAFFNDNCFQELSNPEHIHIDLYGNYITGLCAGISLGNAYKLNNLYSGINLKEKPILDLLVNSGVEGLLKLAQDQFGYEVLPDGYIAKCHLCQDIRKHITAQTDQFDELKPVQFYKYI